MKKFALSLLFGGLLLASGLTANAQYSNAVGVRLGDSYGVTYKTFLQSNRAMDFILNLRNSNNVNYVRLTALYELHNPIADVPGLSWYYGGGGTIGQVKYKEGNRNKELYLSLDGVLGLDYTLEATPLNFSLDWKPAAVLRPNADFDANGIGASVRITF